MTEQVTNHRGQFLTDVTRKLSVYKALICITNVCIYCAMSRVQKTKIVSLPVRERMLNLWVAGESFAAIASRTGVTSKTVSNIVRQFIERGHLFPLKPGGK